ncbi:MAG: S8 family serine peptidase, partial [Flavobacteriales bacterium]|nr:S8 family serine peptidase [Flavobacteriales bacterium]
MDRLLLTQLLIVFSLIGFSQNKIPSDQLMFRNEVLKHPHLNPFLKADLVNQTGNKTLTIKVKSKNNIPGAKNSSTSNYQEITGNASDIFQVIRSVHPEEIIYDPRVGQVLNDEVLDHINASEVHSGTGVAQSKGKGVIMGIIDTGIELAHPDFQDSLGNSRVIGYWNQDDVSNPGKAPSKFGYGSEWSANEINSGQAVVKADHHGTHVAGIAAGNGLATGTHLGVAPESDIVFVQWFTNGGRDWKGTVADAVQYIFDFADSQGKPCVINISLGAYWGPHDGRDPAALRIDSMLDAKPGRAVICAAGNSGAGYNYHVRHDVVGDTAFSWFEFIQAAGYDLDLSGVADSGVFFESWSDTADYKNLKFSFGADDLTGTGKYRGSTSFKTFNPGWNYDTLYSLSGNRLATVQVFLQLQGDRYWMFVGMPSPDSAQYTYRLTSAGSGKLDIWSCPSFTSSSRMIMDDSMKAIVSYPGIDHLVIPDSNYKIVDSWACSPKVITVGNYVNKSTYVDFAGQVQTFPETVGEIFVSSSSGPTRDDRIKPD